MSVCHAGSERSLKPGLLIEDGVPAAQEKSPLQDLQGPYRRSDRRSTNSKAKRDLYIEKHTNSKIGRKAEEPQGRGGGLREATEASMELVRKPAPMRRRVSAFQGRKSLRERGREREV